MPRLYRESPLNSIWEGSGNVQCLDVLRAMVKSPASLEAFFAEVDEGAGAEPRLDAFAAALRDELPGDIETIEARARRIVERMALALQGSLLVRYGDQAVADAFCASRLDGRLGPAPSAPCRPAPTSAASSSATARAPERLAPAAGAPAKWPAGPGTLLTTRPSSPPARRDHAGGGRRRRPPSGRRSGAGSGWRAASRAGRRRGPGRCRRRARRRSET